MVPNELDVPAAVTPRASSRVNSRRHSEVVDLVGMQCGLKKVLSWGRLQIWEHVWPKRKMWRKVQDMQWSPIDGENTFVNHPCTHTLNDKNVSELCSGAFADALRAGVCRG